MTGEATWVEPASVDTVSNVSSVSPSVVKGVETMKLNPSNAAAVLEAHGRLIPPVPIKGSVSSVMSAASSTGADPAGVNAPSPVRSPPPAPPNSSPPSSLSCG